MLWLLMYWVQNQVAAPFLCCSLDWLMQQSLEVYQQNFAELLVMTAPRTLQIWMCSLQHPCFDCSYCCQLLLARGLAHISLGALRSLLACQTLWRKGVRTAHDHG